MYSKEQCDEQKARLRRQSKSQQSEKLDYEQVKKWIDDCEKSHACATVQEFHEVASLVVTIFVDVVDKCLVRRLVSDTRYVSLSYVRGAVDIFETTTDNVEELMKPGALAEKPLNQVFKDAMNATEGLGERYLWVDALCIPQDNGPHKAEAIERMDIVYSFSLVTIVALSGLNADSSLPGVREGTRMASEALVEIIDDVSGDDDTEATSKGDEGREKDIGPVDSDEKGESGVDEISKISSGTDGDNKAEPDSVGGHAEEEVDPGDGDVKGNPLGDSDDNEDPPRAEEGEVNDQTNNDNGDMTARPAAAFAVFRASLEEIIERSVYITRGWTFQERLLPPRTLLFTTHALFFRCRSSLHSDSPLYPGDAFSTHLLTFAASASAAGAGAAPPPPLATFPATPGLSAAAFAQYAAVVRQYTALTLTYSTDRLPAASGVLAAMGRRFGWRFRAGLPDRHLARALAWRAAAPRGFRRNAAFPSWSWAGWTGGVRVDCDFLGPSGEAEAGAARGGHVGVGPEGLEIVDERVARAAMDRVLCVRARVAPFAAVVADTKSKHERALADASSRPAVEVSYPIDVASGGTGRSIRCGLLYCTAWYGSPELWEVVGEDGEDTPKYELVELSRHELGKQRDHWSRYGRHIQDKWDFFFFDDEILPYRRACLVDVMLVKVCESWAERVTVGVIHEDIWEKIASPFKKLIRLQ